MVISLCPDQTLFFTLWCPLRDPHEFSKIPRPIVSFSKVPYLDTWDEDIVGRPQQSHPYQGQWNDLEPHCADFSPSVYTLPSLTWGPGTEKPESPFTRINRTVIKFIKKDNTCETPFKSYNMMFLLPPLIPGSWFLLVTGIKLPKTFWKRETKQTNLYPCKQKQSPLNDKRTINM